MPTPFSPSSTYSPPPVTKKRVISSPRTAHDLTLRLGNDGLRGSHSGMVSPLTELLASSPSHLQLLSNETILSPSSWDGRGGSGNQQGVQPAREQARVAAAVDLMSPIEARSTRLGNNPGCSSPPYAPLHLAGEPIATDGTANSLAPLSGKKSASITMARNSTEKNSVFAKQDILSLSGTVSTTSSASRGTGRTTVPTLMRKIATRDDDDAQAPSAFNEIFTNAATGDTAVVEHEIPHARRTQHETRGSLTEGTGSAGHGMGACVPIGTPGTASRTVDTYGLPNALLVGGGSSNGTTPHTPSTTVVSPHSRSTIAASFLTTSLHLTTGNSNPSGVGSAGVATQPHSMCSFTPNNCSQESLGRQARAPRLASHLLLDDGTIVESTLPPASLLSPAVRDVKRRSGLRNDTGRLSVAALDQSRTPLCSVEGPVSLSGESYTLTTLSLSSDMSRPTAANFVKGELIGKGSYGAVYRGMLRSNNRIIAMKEIRLPDAIRQELQQSENIASPAVLPPGSVMSPVLQTSTSPKGKCTVAKRVEAIQRELMLLKQLRHPNIVRYLNDEVVDGTLRIYMEYVSGGSVTAALKSFGKFEEPQAAALCYQLLQGLAYMHRNGIVHRDLKGDNLLLETSSQLKIADLGTAKSIISSATMTANIVGTAYFMAPEVLQPDVAAVGTAADIWSVACCVIEMLTGKPPLSELPNQFTVMMTIGGSAAVPLDKYIPAGNTWSKEVLDFISQCLRVNPAERPTAVDLLHHSWFAKLLNLTHISAAESASATLNSFPTPTAPSVERLFHLGPHRNLISPTFSPVLTTSLVPGYSGPQGGLYQPESHTSSRTSSHASKGRKVKREIQSSSRRHVHQSSSGIASATSLRSQGSSQASTPKNDSSTRTCDGTSPSSSTMRTHTPPVRQRGSNTKRKYNVPNMSRGLVTDDTQQGCSGENVVHNRTSFSGCVGGSSGDSRESKGKGAFLPVITLVGGPASSPCGESLDALRSSRCVKNGGSSREPTKTYSSPSDAESMAHESVPLVYGAVDHRQSVSRDVVDSSMPCRSFAKVSVDGGSSTRSAGCLNKARDVENSGKRPAPPSLSLPPSSASRKPHKGF